MSVTPYPLPRETRESAILVGNGTVGPYGPSLYKIFDILDVAVFARAAGENVFSDVTDQVTVTKTTDADYDTFSVTFDAAIPASTEWYHQARRVAERAVAVTRAGTIDSNQLEKELSKQATTQSEMRRDVDRAYAAQPGSSPGFVIPGAAGELMTSDAAGNLVGSGENVTTIIGSTAAAQAAVVAAEAHADDAAESADDAEAYALAAQSVSTELAHPVTRAALKALNTATHTAAVVVEPNFERIARWNPTADPYMNTIDPDEKVFAQPTPASVGSWVMSPVPKKQIGIFEQIKYRMTVGRVDFVGIGDSNQLLSGHGWDHGFQYALSQHFPMWATGLLSQGENNGSGSGQGYLYSRIGALIGAVSGAPADLGKYLDKGAGSIFPAYYTYLADGGSFSSNSQCGLFLSANCPIDNGAALDFDLYWGSFTTGAGSFKPSVRIDQSPFNFLNVPASPTSTNTGAYGIQKTTLSITADPTRVDKAVGFKPIVTGNTGIVGPYFSTYYRARNPGRLTGFSYGTLEYRGGQSARTMANDLQQASNDTLTHYFSILRADQGSGTKTIVICINSGLNDRNEGSASLGTAAIADGDSAPAFVDNFRAIVARIKAIWTLNGWNQKELFWILQVSHPQSSPDDAELVAYRAALEAYALYVGQAQVIDLSVVVPYADLIANGWYLNPVTDHNHLTQAGFEGASAAIIGAVL
ncbi:SGNH/GDSL hydrolase family protein [Mesorhizobium sp.]|uniref:SGNH/GDSL hydrolase family protein n=1 Tax=Mesorhizobium sp. TaxID=1871066 RepID=UPI00121BF708|nr:SGNH/GDSL hydrolase family protein [Mesorhizobium sp.]TIL53770.1 MAG: hypothetical protein E5Y83_05630 [Mesorhizobium sp.]